jgi:putative PIN family toxin of toxin-antitoxin system
VRVILDTNVLVSATISPGGRPAALVEAWIDRRFILVSHPIQLDELREVSRRPKVKALIQPAAAGRIINQIKLTAEMPKALPDVQRSPDPRDDFLLGLCEAGQADWLVTGDKNDLLALDRHEQTHIVTAAQFAEELGIG